MYKKTPKNSYLAIHLLSLNRSSKLWFCSLTLWCHCVGHSLKHLSSWANGWNKRPPCSALISSHKAPNQRMRMGRHLM